MIALGVILAILGFFFSHILMVIGIILVVVGLVFHFMGTAGRPVAGRRYWYYHQSPVAGRVDWLNSHAARFTGHAKENHSGAQVASGYWNM